MVPRAWLILSIFVLSLSRTDCLTFPETIYRGVSDACRVLMNSNSGPRFGSIIDKLSVLWYTNDGVKKLSLNSSDVIIWSEDFRPDLMTVVTIHGFNDHPESFIPSSISEAYVKKKKYNVMMLDCQELTKDDYPKAAYMSKLIAKAFARFMMELIKSSKLVPENVHIIGISLGAQIAGWIGRYLKESTGMLHRITGLDPAGPCFAYSGESLGKNDANYVDIIHVNAPIQGTPETTGHADYFVNGGGPNQPGCNNVSCSHKRASFLYIESIETGNFQARKCESWDLFNIGGCNLNKLSYMGYNSSIKSRGSYYLKTTSQSPYAMGIYGTLTESRIRIFFNLIPI